MKTRFMELRQCLLFAFATRLLVKSHARVALTLCLLAISLMTGCTAGEETVPLRPDYPIADGHTRLTPEWSLVLDQPVNRRLEGGSLVLWRPGFTIWINFWGNEVGETVEERAQWIVSEISPAAFDAVSGPDGDVYRHAYRLSEDRPQGPIEAYYGFVVSPTGHVQIAVYFDTLDDLPRAKSIVESLRYLGR